MNRLIGVQANSSNAVVQGYDLVGNLVGAQYGNAVTNLYQYDKLNRLTNSVWNLGGGNLASFYYQLGLTGNRTNLIEYVAGTNQTYAWQYDRNYRLTNEIIGSSGVGYGLDPVGNRLSRSGSAPQTFTYNTNDWLKTDNYDNNGNTLWTTNSGAAIGPYGYDVENRLTNFNNGAVSVGYNGDGWRVRKTVAGVTNYYVVDDRNPSGYAQVLEEWSGVGVSRIYNYGTSLISQRNASSGAIYYYGADGHGSVRFLTDTNGNPVNTYAYDAYGNLIASDITIVNVYLYCGEPYDTNLGMYFLRARYMDTGTGRFWTMDTFQGDQTDPLSLHKYLYCEGNPVNHGDPSGHDLTEMLTVVAISAVIVGEFGYTYNSVWRETAGNVGTVNVYVSPGGTANARTVHDQIIAKALAIEAQYRQATQLRIMDGGLPAGVSVGYNQSTHTYNVLVQHTE